MTVHKASESVAQHIDDRLHGTELIYGNTANDMTADIPIKFTVTGGDNAWGTELMLTDGTVVDSGSTSSEFDADTLYVVSTSAANKISILEFLHSPINTAVACTFDFTAHGSGEDVVISAGHGLSNGDKIVLKAGGGALPAELLDYVTYYVVDANTDDFNVSLTTGGADVAFTDDGGACFWYPVESAVQTAVQTSVTKICISMAAVNADAMPFRMPMPSIPCDNRLFIRAKSETGQTVGVGFLLGVHIHA